MENTKRATKRAVICYAFGDLASQFVWTFVGSYLTIYYTDILGLTPLAVSAIMIIARVWDAINDCRENKIKMGKIPSVYCIWLSFSGTVFGTYVYQSLRWRSEYGKCTLGGFHLYRSRDALYSD